MTTYVWGGAVLFLLIIIATRLDALARAVVAAVDLAKREAAAEIAAKEQAAIDAKIQALAGASRRRDRTDV